MNLPFYKKQQFLFIFKVWWKSIFVIMFYNFLILLFFNTGPILAILWSVFIWTFAAFILTSPFFVLMIFLTKYLTKSGKNVTAIKVIIWSSYVVTLLALIAGLTYLILGNLSRVYAPNPVKTALIYFNYLFVPAVLLFLTPLTPSDLERNSSIIEDDILDANL